MYKPIYHISIKDGKKKRSKATKKKKSTYEYYWHNN